MVRSSVTSRSCSFALTGPRRRGLTPDRGVSKSTVSRICAEIDEQVAVLRERRLDHTAFPYVFLDATYVKARVNHQVVSRAVGDRHRRDRRRQP